MALKPVNVPSTLTSPPPNATNAWSMLARVAGPGWLLALAGKEMRWPSWRLSLLLGFFIGLTLEGLQVLVFSGISEGISVITRSIGFERDVKVDIAALPLSRGDRFVSRLVRRSDSSTDMPACRLIERFS